MKIIKRSIMLLGLLFAVHVNTQAQQIDDNSITNLVLKDGTTVVLYQGLPAELKSLDANGNPKANPAHDWYYLPTNLRLTSRPDGVPEFYVYKIHNGKELRSKRCDHALSDEVRFDTGSTGRTTKDVGRPYK